MSSMSSKSNDEVANIIDAAADNVYRIVSGYRPFTVAGGQAARTYLRDLAEKIRQEPVTSPSLATYTATRDTE
jgi:hypothetical protein